MERGRGDGAARVLLACLFGVRVRSFHHRKYDARETLEAFSTRLRDETNLDQLSRDLVGVVRETVQPEHVSLWLRPTDRVVRR